MASVSDEWVESKERAEYLSKNEKWIAGIAVASGVICLASFTGIKWEVDRRVKDMSDEDQQLFYDGTYKQVKEAEAAAMQLECEGFVAASEFAGPRPGMAFKLGPAGLGNRT